MVDSETIETKIADKKEKVDGKIDDAKEKFDEKKDEQKDKYAETKEKGKNLADNVVSDLSKTIEEIKENLKNSIGVLGIKTEKNLDIKFLFLMMPKINTNFIKLIYPSHLPIVQETL